ncbi:esterase [Pseudoduganella eburnea]|uniref:Esterase n=1 Tax=Massilia eburnea TaxID=1776165 RepID=A0A6L6QFJ6_9BURK|nr:alpha/beta hydrolase-fold protein [Massilia eburnea]MTW10854.1 esterase [Massilia eburnea]
MRRLPGRQALAALLAAALASTASFARAGAAVDLPFGSYKASFATPDPQAALRSYTQTTTMPLRDGAPQSITYTEQAGLPQVRSGNLAFDALFALAIAEMRQDSVQAIRDGSYNGGAPIACECFETGEKWHYVWTRDLSYAASLGLAMLDPIRTRNSLQFKLSGYRGGKPPLAAGSDDGLQIVQDTGSGGSWPVSTDRVSWAFGAEQTLNALPPEERKQFAAIALKALRNTIENDRIAAFDHASGLYNGEQSFLDWREQSYAAWIPGDLSSMASSKALSTNVAHYKALTLAAELAQQSGEHDAAKRYARWAADLKIAINDRLWLKDAGMYSSLTAGHFDGAATHKFDWLGQSLAIVTGVADAEQAQSILARYPHGPLGAPVIWPQQPGVPVYHNRALWPFVTAYGLRAAAQYGNVAVADAAYASLLQGAALNLSNMENMEWRSGDPSAPAINSRRQLWSVGGFLGMVVQQVFGISADTERLHVSPFITSRLRREWFAGSGVIELSGLTLHGKRLHLKIKLPPAEARDGYYLPIGGKLNGKDAGGSAAWNELAEDNLLEVEMGPLVEGRQQITLAGSEAASTAPPEPVLQQKAPSGGAKRDSWAAFRIEPGAGTSPDARFTIYRDGKLAAAGVAAGDWTDRAMRTAAPCYAAEAIYPAAGTRSHHSQPACLADASSTGEAVSVARDGRYHVQLRYNNHAHQINLGITNAVQMLRLRDQQGAVAAEGIVQMPHNAPANGPAWSTPLTAHLKRGSYRLELQPFYNMSTLQSNASYADAGGASGARNSAEVLGVRLQPAPAAAAPPRHGTLQLVENFKSPQLGNERTLRIYLPPSYGSDTKRRYPVLYMHDGQNLFEPKTASYGTEWNIDEVMDRLERQGEMEEVIVVGIDNTSDRIGEYTGSSDPKYGGGKLDAYAAFVAQTVKPWVDSQYRTKPGREHTAVMGSSLGGLASIGIAQRYPQLFSMAGGFSSSFWWNGQEALKHPPLRMPVRFYIDAGTVNDGLEESEAFRQAMVKQGYREGRDLLFLADPGGRHNEQSWASRVHVALAWFFGKKP